MPHNFPLTNFSRSIYVTIWWLPSEKMLPTLRLFSTFSVFCFLIFRFFVRSWALRSLFFLVAFVSLARLAGWLAALLGPACLTIRVVTSAKAHSNRRGWGGLFFG